MSKAAAKSSNSSADPAKSSGEAPRKPTTSESVRETVDSIVIAFVLAFLFRTFEAEAFVIPTGSMALTLMGDHKDLNCAKCNYPYRVSASSESPSNHYNHQKAYDEDPEAWVYANAVTSGVCPNCRYRMHFDSPEEVPIDRKTGRPRFALTGPPPDEPMQPSYKGDRILVTKYSYEFDNPARWDVAVFKNPNQAKINYIKRIVGLPNEEVMIYRGDIYVRSNAQAPFQMARKPHDKFLAVAQTVYDNDYVLPLLHERGWPQRWTATGDGAAQWKQSDDLKSFSAAATAGAHWLRYQHYVPNSYDWETLAQESLSPEQTARIAPQLITDFCEYNSEWTRLPMRHGRDYSYLGWHWVGDIGVECELTFGDRTGDDAAALLEIVEGGVAYRCRIDAETGDMSLSIDGLEGFRPTAQGVVAGAGPHRLRFANVDDQLLAWVDDEPVAFDASTNFQTVDQVQAEVGGKPQTYAFDGAGTGPPLSNVIPKSQDVSSPVGIAAVNCGLDVAHLRILRDVYYIADRYRGEDASSMYDYDEGARVRFRNELDRLSLQPLLGGQNDVRDIAIFMSKIDVQPERFAQTLPVVFPLAEDQFFVLGDNSPRSSDARLWKSENYVRRELLIGKALFVYWPHGLETIPGTGITVPDLPLIGGQYVPNFGRMRIIR